MSVELLMISFPTMEVEDLLKDPHHLQFRRTKKGLNNSVQCTFPQSFHFLLQISSICVGRSDGGVMTLCIKIPYSALTQAHNQDGSSTLAESYRVT